MLPASADTADTVTGVDVADMAADADPSMLLHCVADSSNADRPVGLLHRKRLLNTSKTDSDISCRVSVDVSGSLLKRLAADDACDVPHKCAATHSSALDTSTVGMNNAVAGNTSALPSFPNVTLPSFPPTLFSCFPSLGNSCRAQSSGRCAARAVSQTVLTTDATCLSTTNPPSTLFSIPVHGVARGVCPLLLVPSLQNCVLVPSLCSAPLLYVFNAASSSHSTSSPTGVAPVVGIPHVAGNSQPNIPLLSHLLRPLGRALSSDQSAAPTAGQNLSIAGNSQLVPLSLPSIPIASCVQRPVGGAFGSDQSYTLTAAGVGIPRISGSSQLLSVPNIAIRSPALWPLGVASASNQSCTPAAIGVGIPRDARNSLPLGFPLPNIPLLSQLLRPVGRAPVSVDQSAIRLVSCVGNLRGPCGVVSSCANTQPRLNGVVSPRSNAAFVVPGFLRQSQSPTMPPSSKTFLPTLPRSSTAVLQTPSLPSSFLLSTSCPTLPNQTSPRSSTAVLQTPSLPSSFPLSTSCQTLPNITSPRSSTAVLQTSSLPSSFLLSTSCQTLPNQTLLRSSTAVLQTPSLPSSFLLSTSCPTLPNITSPRSSTAVLQTSSLPSSSLLSTSCQTLPNITSPRSSTAVLQTPSLPSSFLLSTSCPTLPNITSPRSSTAVLQTSSLPSSFLLSTSCPTLPNITSPRSSTAVPQTPSVPCPLLLSTGCPPTAGNSMHYHESVCDSPVLSLSGVAHVNLSQKSTERQRSSAAGSLSTRSILLTILSERAPADMMTSCLSVAETVNSLSTSSCDVSTSLSHLCESSSQRDSSSDHTASQR